MATLTGNTIASTYTGLLSVSGAVGADTVEAVTDGAGTSTSLSLSQQRATITLGSGAADDFIVDGTALVVEGDNHRVGIGTAAPSNQLHLESSTSTTMLMKNTGNSGSQIDGDANRSSADSTIMGIVGKWNGTAVADILIVSGADTSNKDDGDIVFRTAPSGTLAERVRIDSAGNVGIGESSPSEKLHIGGDFADYRIYSRTGIENGTVAFNEYYTGSAWANDDDDIVSGAMRFSDSRDSLEFGVRAGGATAGYSTTHMTIKSTGAVGIGTNSPDNLLHIKTTGSTPSIELEQDAGTSYKALFKLAGNDLEIRGSSGKMEFYNGGNNDGDSATLAMTIDSSQKVGIGTASPGGVLQIDAGLGAPSDLGNFEEYHLILRDSGGATNDAVGMLFTSSADTYGGSAIVHYDTGSGGKGDLVFYTKQSTAAVAPAEIMRLNDNGNVGIGVYPEAQLHIWAGDEQVSRGVFLDNNRVQDNCEFIKFRKKSGSAVPTSGHTVGSIQFAQWDGDEYHNAATIVSKCTGSVSNNAPKGNLIFSTIDGTDPNPAERMRIASNGNVMIGRTSDTFNNDGILIGPSSFIYLERSAGTSNSVLYLHRRNGDGSLIDFYESNSLEGSISVSGSTVSYNGFSGTHDSSGIASDTAIGTVLSTIDEEHKADHAKVKVSDSVGDKRVYGVLQQYVEETTNDDTEQTIPEHAVVASVGIGSVKVTGACQGGDLLESNGDGTAKVQDDDIIRSKTIGKVTIGDSKKSVKLVSCVLYCG